MSDPKETKVTIQDVDREGMKTIWNDKNDLPRPAHGQSMFIPSTNINLILGMRSTGTSMDNFFFSGEWR